MPCYVSPNYYDKETLKMKKIILTLSFILLTVNVRSAVTIAYPIPAITAPMIACYATKFSTAEFLINSDADKFYPDREKCHREALALPFSAIIAGFTASLRNIDELTIFHRLAVVLYGVILLNDDSTTAELTPIDINDLPEDISAKDAIEYNNYKTELEMVLNIVSVEASNNPEMTGVDVISHSHSLMDDLEIPENVRSTFKKLFTPPLSY